jgi:hypothetical protein
VTADLNEGMQVERAMQTATTALSEAMRGTKPEELPTLLAYSDSSVTANGALGNGRARAPNRHGRWMGTGNRQAWRSKERLETVTMIDQRRIICSVRRIHQCRILRKFVIDLHHEVVNRSIWILYCILSIISSRPDSAATATAGKPTTSTRPVSYAIALHDRTDGARWSGTALVHAPRRVLSQTS